jgi:hypothetical protein
MNTERGDERTKFSFVFVEFLLFGVINYWTYKACLSQSDKVVQMHNVTRLCRTPAAYRGADKSLARPGRKEATTTQDFEFHISYL